MLGDESGSNEVKTTTIILFVLNNANGYYELEFSIKLYTHRRRKMERGRCRYMANAVSSRLCQRAMPC